MKNLIESMDLFIKVSIDRLKERATPIQDTTDFDILQNKNDLVRFANIYNHVANSENMANLIDNYCSTFYPHIDQAKHKLKSLLGYFADQYDCYQEMFGTEITRTIGGVLYQTFDRDTGNPICQKFEPGNSDSWNGTPLDGVDYSMSMEMVQPSSHMVQKPEDWVTVPNTAGSHFEFKNFLAGCTIFRTIQDGPESLLEISDKSRGTKQVFTPLDINKMLPFFQHFAETGNFPSTFVPRQ